MDLYRARGPADTGKGGFEYLRLQVHTHILSGYLKIVLVRLLIIMSRYLKKHLKGGRTCFGP
jgi:hypothetical protein